MPKVTQQAGVAELRAETRRGSATTAGVGSSLGSWRSDPGGGGGARLTGRDQPSPSLPSAWTPIVLSTGSGWAEETHSPNLSAPRAATSALQNKWVFLATFAAVLGNFSFGYALVYTSPVIPALERSLDPNLSLTKTQASWFGVRAAL